MNSTAEFLSGVIEGFYGPPWSRTERRQLFDWLSELGLNTYLYAPKDDLNHRARWRENYSPEAIEALGELIAACADKQLRFIYAISPGLDIRYSNPADLETLRGRFQQLLARGCENFALLLDDIPDRLHAEDAARWGSFAEAQCHVANELFRWVRQHSPTARFLFCPTPYCGRMAERQYGGAGYLETVGRLLLPAIDIFWTGPEIISRELPLEHIRSLQAVLRRKPLIWDNLFANDYDGRRFFCGPYSGRPLELRDEVSGLLLNPNNEFPLNFVPLRTFSRYLSSAGDYSPGQAYVAAMEEWLPAFATVAEPVTAEQLRHFGDCFYLPYEDGWWAKSLSKAIGTLLRLHPAQWAEAAEAFRKSVRPLRGFCSRVTELQDRALFAALHRRVWELREELDLLDGYVEFKAKPGNADKPFASDFHQPGTYRGSFVARLQELLALHADGIVSPAAYLNQMPNKP